MTYLSHRVYGRYRHEAFWSRVHSLHTDPASPILTGRMFIGAFTVSSQGRLPTWQPWIIWSQLKNMNYFITFSVYECMIKTQLYVFKGLVGTKVYMTYSYRTITVFGVLVLGNLTTFNCLLSSVCNG
jgi:hypothetical protein